MKVGVKKANVMLLNIRPRLNYQCEAVKDYNKNLLTNISKTYRMKNSPDILKKKKCFHKTISVSE